jgi:monoterpene epsilon-lactone hydrolase
MPVLAIDYRMPPKHPFPAGLDDVIAVYTRLLQERPADSIVMGGTSAGAGLALAAIHRLKGAGAGPSGRRVRRNALDRPD